MYDLNIQFINLYYTRQIGLLKMTNKNKKLSNHQNYSITIEGSLGLLAYGDVGLRLWREVKQKNNLKNNLNEAE